MEEFLEVNGNWIITKDHMLFVEDKGMIKAEKLEEGDVIVGIAGNTKVLKIIKPIERPDAPIIG